MEKDCFTLENAKNKALNYLSFQARTEDELRRYLTVKGFPKELVEQVLVWTREYRMIDDRDFTSCWIENRRQLKPMGKRRMAFELKNKGVAEDIVQSQLDQVTEEEEVQVALALARSRLQRATRPITRERLMSWLMRKGFTLDTCYKVVNTLKNEPDWDRKVLNS